ncbi:hypothetical protein NM688_g1534 [Phlebia brevispora]|uniref:Uncharacterized protein n=1 Tax=Phlebia brevispora TaxID=194682 RepID=A0ACC1TB25_9APHY|nr:hypothetical protein NM688_g1534 [Phlebia brevispora]
MARIKKRQFKLAAALMRIESSSRGCLKDLPTVPVDILAEVMAHLLPLDILNLSRTTKAFRRFLMVRAAEFIWRRARGNAAGLPPLPDDMSEPAYASLMFDTYCHGCSADGFDTICWDLRLRYCVSCRERYFLLRGSIVKLYPELEPWCHINFYRAYPMMSFEERMHFHLPHVEALLQKTPKEELESARIKHGCGEGDWAARVFTESRRRVRTANLHVLTIVSLALLARYIMQNVGMGQEEDVIRSILREREEVPFCTGLGFRPELKVAKSREYDIRGCPGVWEAKELADEDWEEIQGPLLERLMDVRSLLEKP